MQVTLANGLRPYESNKNQAQRESQARDSSVEDLYGSASLVRACLSKFATVQLLRMQHHHEFLEFRSSPDTGVQKVAKLPTPSIELCCWIFQLLAEEGRVMFSQMALRAINNVIWSHGGEKRLSLLHSLSARDFNPCSKYCFLSFALPLAKVPSARPTLPDANSKERQG